MLTVPQNRPEAKVAILVRTRNRSHLLRRALAGIYAQTETDWLLMLLNDGGDRSALDEIVASSPTAFRSKIHVREVPPPNGRHTSGRPLNLGLRESQSRWVVVHDDDDSWHPEFLSRSLQQMEKEGTRASVCIAERIEERWNGTAFETISSELYNSWQSLGISLFRLAESNTFPPHCLVYERSLLSSVDPYPENLEALEDWVFNLRIWQTCEVSFVASPLARYHFRVEGSTDADLNSFYAQADRLARMDLKIRNQLLREDLAAGRVGLGFLVNMARSHGQLFQEIQKSSPQ